MSLAGTGVVAIWHDLLPEAKATSTNGTTASTCRSASASRAFAAAAATSRSAATPEFFNLYEADTPGSARRAATTSIASTLRRNGRNASCRRSATSLARSAAWRSAAASAAAESMLTVRFDVDAAHRAVGGRFTDDEHLCRRSALRTGIAGVHLCLADEAISNVETAEKKARADATLVPTWIVLIEGIGPSRGRMRPRRISHRRCSRHQRRCARDRDLPARIHTTQDAAKRRLIGLLATLTGAHLRCPAAGIASCA